jgi:hypothetical protein
MGDAFPGEAVSFKNIITILLLLGSYAEDKGICEC